MSCRREWQGLPSTVRAQQPPPARATATGGVRCSHRPARADAGKLPHKDTSHSLQCSSPSLKGLRPHPCPAGRQRGWPAAPASPSVNQHGWLGDPAAAPHVCNYPLIESRLAAFGFHMLAARSSFRLQASPAGGAVTSGSSRARRLCIAVRARHQLQPEREAAGRRASSGGVAVASGGPAGLSFCMLLCRDATWHHQCESHASQERGHTTQPGCGGNRWSWAARRRCSARCATGSTHRGMSCTMWRRCTCLCPVACCSWRRAGGWRGRGWGWSEGLRAGRTPLPPSHLSCCVLCAHGPLCRWVPLMFALEGE